MRWGYNRSEARFHRASSLKWISVVESLSPPNKGGLTIDLPATRGSAFSGGMGNMSPLLEDYKASDYMGREK